MESREGYGICDILTMKQVHHVLDQAVGGCWSLVRAEVKPACVGISGFVGDHFRVTFDVKVADSVKKVHIFVKSMPLANEPKAKAIDQSNFYRREMLMFELFEKMGAGQPEDPTSWCARAYIYTDHLVVMPDLAQRGYGQRPPLACLDLDHCLLTVAAIARFHAAFANYETKRTVNGHLPFSQEYADILTDPTFSDSPWLRAAAKLTKNILTTFSDKSDQYPADLEDILIKLYIQACETPAESASLNVVIHKDLWINNIMYKYEGDRPTNALLIDFQCIRYGPPAFDVMIFLYLNTSRSFRKIYKSMLLNHYFTTFLENVTNATKARLHILGYDYNDFVTWCEKARMFSMLVAMAIFPYALMEPSVAQKTFDNPTTFIEYCDVDRTGPVVAHARASAGYRLRQLEVSEEFVDQYVLKTLHSEN